MTLVVPSTLTEAAVAYAAAGWEIFPGNPRTKAPLVEHGALDATADPATVTAWWTRWPDALICHRLPTGVVLVDVDVRHGGDHTWRAIKHELGIPSTRAHHSGRGDGGGHVWFTTTLERPSVRGLDEWARQRGHGHATPTGGWSAGIDLLHRNHRYTILPPSPHPDTGLPYTWKTGPDAPVAAMPAELETLLRPPAPVSSAPAGRPAGDPDSIADWYTATHTVDELLERHGWSRVGHANGDGQRWRHPQATNAHSATVRHGCLFVYTPTPGLPVTEPGDPHGLTPFRLYALLDHHGDQTAAARAARQLKDGPPRGAPDVSWADQPATEAWADPQPLVDVHTPPFPLEMLPAWIGDHCDAVADRLQVPPDLCAQLALGVLATVAMGHARIHVTNTWTEPANLYLATVMPSGAGKSPADRYMVAPLRRLENELLEQSDQDRRKAEHQRAIAERKARKLTEKAANSDDQHAVTEAWAALQQAESIEPQPEPRLLASDVTPEMLAVLLARHNGRIAIVSTEADLYDVVLGSYSKRPNVSVLLKGWSGDEVIVDRKGGSGSPATAVRVPEALLTVSITVQPIAIATLRRNPELEAKGFVPRFMHAWPKDLVGQRDHRRALDTRPLTTMAPYEQHVLELGHRLHSWQVPADLHYHHQAADRFIDWRQQLEPKLAGDGTHAHLASWAPKIAGSVARLAGLLHLANQHRPSEPIEPATIDAALTIGDYWLAHAEAVLANGGADLAGAERILRWIRTKKPDRFTRRDVMQGIRGRNSYTKIEDVEPALDRLESTGHIRPIDKGWKGSSRPNPVFEAHPQLLEETGNAAARLV